MDWWEELGRGWMWLPALLGADLGMHQQGVGVIATIRSGIVGGQEFVVFRTQTISLPPSIVSASPRSPGRAIEDRRSGAPPGI